MKGALTTIVVLTLLTLPSLPATADWDPGDGHMMYEPQMPGDHAWAVPFSLSGGIGSRLSLADDWLCTQSGPVSEIHFWFSSMADRDPSPMRAIYATIYSDVPAEQSSTGYSMPGETVLWQGEFQQGEFTVRKWGEGDQGWFEPWSEPAVILHDHQNIYQANIVDIPGPFPQEKGNIYWLGLTVWTDPITPPQEPVRLGWKTSDNHWNDAAVYDVGAATDPPFWRPLWDPYIIEPLDLAFVITPEPSTLVTLLSVGLIGLAAYALPRRKGQRGRTPARSRL